MGKLLLFSLQLLLIGGVFKLVLFMFIPKPIRKLFLKVIPKSIATLYRGIVSLIFAIREDFTSDEEEQLEEDDTLPSNVLIFKRKAK